MGGLPASRAHRRFRVAVVLLLLLEASPAVARDNGQWFKLPGYLRQWFQK